jgi:dipeptidyl aminopeptidase/acylaminoacyl peptidase
MVQMANPITYVQADVPPFLLIHGEPDEIVPCTQSELLAQALQARGNAMTFISIPGVGHNFGADEASWQAAQRLVLAFFNRELGIPLAPVLS